MKNGNKYTTSPVDEHIGFRAHDWSSRLTQVATLAEKDLSTRGFKVNSIKLYERTNLFEKEDFGLVIEWNVDSPM